MKAIKSATESPMLTLNDWLQIKKKETSHKIFLDVQKQNFIANVMVTYEKHLQEKSAPSKELGISAGGTGTINCDPTSSMN